MTGPASASRPPLILRLPVPATILISAAVYSALGYALTARPPAALGPALRTLLDLAPHLIAAINLTALACLLAGYRAIRARRVGAHRAFMLAAASLISAFLVLYVGRVVLGGIKAFEGPAAVRTFVYLPTLTVHITLSIVSVPLIVFNLFTGLALPRRQVRRTAHPRVGRAGVLLWSVSLALGVAVYLLLNVLY